VAKVATFRLAFCVLGCFFGSGLKSFCGLRLSGLALVWLAVFYGLFALTAGELLAVLRPGAGDAEAAGTRQFSVGSAVQQSGLPLADFLKNSSSLKLS
jgi:hypothetical protein